MTKLPQWYVSTCNTTHSLKKCTKDNKIKKVTLKIDNMHFTEILKNRKKVCKAKKMEIYPKKKCT